MKVVFSQLRHCCKQKVYYPGTGRCLKFKKEKRKKSASKCERINNTQHEWIDVPVKYPPTTLPFQLEKKVFSHG